MTATLYPHIEEDERGRLFVTGTGLKVILLITDHIAWKFDAVQLAAGYPALSIAAAHSVLAYFYDNESAVRAEIDRIEKEIDEFFRHHKQPSWQEFLARAEAKGAAGLLP